MSFNKSNQYLLISTPYAFFCTKTSYAIPFFHLFSSKDFLGFNSNQKSAFLGKARSLQSFTTVQEEDYLLFIALHQIFILLRGQLHVQVPLHLELLSGAFLLIYHLFNCCFLSLESILCIHIHLNLYRKPLISILKLYILTLLVVLHPNFLPLRCSLFNRNSYFQSLNQVNSSY